MTHVYMHFIQQNYKYKMQNTQTLAYDLRMEIYILGIFIQQNADAMQNITFFLL